MLLGKGQKGTSHCVCVDCEEDWPYESKLQRVIEAALETEGVDVPCAVDVLITDDAGIHQANLETRGVDRPTDVLSFPLMEFEKGAEGRVDPEDEDAVDPDTGLIMLGDIVINMERVFSQAEEYGHSPEREGCYLCVHSVLHLLGWDHMEPEDKKAMRLQEEKLMEGMRLAR